MLQIFQNFKNVKMKIQGKGRVPNPILSTFPLGIFEKNTPQKARPWFCLFSHVWPKFENGLFLPKPMPTLLVPQNCKKIKFLIFMGSRMGFHTSLMI